MRLPKKGAIATAVGTVHGRARAKKAAARSCPKCEREVHQRYCDVCGYDLIEETRAKAPLFPRI